MTIKSVSKRLMPSYFQRYYYIAFFLLFLIVLAYWIEINVIVDEQFNAAFSNSLTLLVNIFSTVCLFWAAKRSIRYSKTAAFPWFILGVAQFLNTIGDLLWAYIELFLPQPPFPSVADIFYVLFYPLFFAGILLLPKNRDHAEQWSKRILDMSIVLIAAFLILWNYVIGPLALSNNYVSLWVLILSMAYPVGDLVLFWAVVVLLYRQVDKADRGPVFLLVISAIFLVVADIIFSIQSMTGEYVSGSLLDISWVLSYLFLGFSGVLKGLTVSREGEHQAFLFTTAFNNLNSLASLFPFIWISGTFALLIHSFFQPMVMESLYISIGVTAIVFLFFIRQHITLIENRKLFKRLDRALKRVQEQALALEFEISEKKRFEDQLLYDASHDALTSLPNRHSLLNRLKEMIEDQNQSSLSSCAILFMDLDNFSLINDSLGQMVGDKLLIQVAQRLKGTVPVNGMVTRLNGDEFVIVLEDVIDENMLLVIMNSLQNKLREVFEIENQNIYVTASIGIVYDLRNYENPQDVLRDADIALYQAKTSGKANFNIFHPELLTQKVEQLVVENEIRRALTYHEFTLFYQPIISLKDYRIVSLEALIRWQNPRRGLISPLEFIPLAEKIGLIPQIGKWVLYEACLQLKKWQVQFPDKEDLSIHINVSSEQLKRPDFLQQLEEVLYTTGINPNALKLEITESVLIENQKAFYKTYSAIRNMGLHLQIDDFGTGYSSLKYLQHIPADTIKIDKSFVQEMEENEKNINLIRAMINMAKSMEMEIVAEGVETQAQLEILKELKCDFVQGYLFYKPLPSTDLETIFLTT